MLIPAIFSLFLVILPTNLAGKCTAKLPFSYCDEANATFNCKDDDKNCVGEEFFCQYSEGTFSENHTCSKFQNLKPEFCATLKFDLTINDANYKYIYVIASTKWEIAELYCQSQGYNLAVFQNTEEFMKVDKIIDEFHQKGEGIKEGDYAKKIISISDPIRQLCFNGKHKISNNYWLGLYPVEKEGSKLKWTPSDGTKFNSSVADEGNVKATSPNDLKSRISLRRGYFRLLEEREQLPIEGKGGEEGYAHILCKRHRKPKKWKPRLGLSTSDNLLGYQCRDDSKKVLIGPEFGSRSQILDSKKDCPNGEDETDFGPPKHTSSSHDQKRKYYFYPLKGKPMAVRKYCKYLPTVQSQHDKNLLGLLPQTFGESRKGPDFWHLDRDWSKEKATKVLLSPASDKGRWEDNTKINKKLLGITDEQFEKMKNKDYYTFLNTETGKLSFEKTSKSSELIYLVCQSHGNILKSAAGLIPGLLLILCLYFRE